MDIVDFKIKENQNELIIYNLRNHVAISLIDGHEHILITESDNSDWKENRSYLKNYWINREVSSSLHELYINQLPENCALTNENGFRLESYPEGTYLESFDQSMLLLSKPFRNHRKKKAVVPTVDMLLINANSGFPGAYSFHSIYPKKIILLGNRNDRLQMAWKKFADSRNIEFYSVNNSGAFHEKFY